MARSYTAKRLSLHNVYRDMRSSSTQSVPSALHPYFARKVGPGSKLGLNCWPVTGNGKVRHQVGSEVEVFGQLHFYWNIVVHQLTATEGFLTKLLTWSQFRS
ncbi:hypothetical protein POM88_052451 [Heracleum sosnowskyi]|uniref:Uncharacterized protein n=1 Tax=Heracleum sosnowskyi TaxID=360622 RepID=A0AAD8GRN8_9APIA|nr:hypothetical protein POM88_052451 [Heracleum sosnowskyi]